MVTDMVKDSSLTVQQLTVVVIVGASSSCSSFLSKPLSWKYPTACCLCSTGISQSRSKTHSRSAAHRHSPRRGHALHTAHTAFPVLLAAVHCLSLYPGTLAALLAQLGLPEGQGPSCLFGGGTAQLPGTPPFVSQFFVLGQTFGLVGRQ